MGEVWLLDLPARNIQVIHFLKPETPVLSHQEKTSTVLRCSFQIQGVKEPKPRPRCQTLFYRPPSLETSSQAEGQAPPHGSDPPLWRGKRRSCKMPERRGAGDGEAQGLHKPTLKAPDGLQSASHRLASSLLLFRCKGRPPTQEHSKPNLLIRCNQLTP